MGDGQGEIGRLITGASSHTREWRLELIHLLLAPERESERTCLAPVALGEEMGLSSRPRSFLFSSQVAPKEEEDEDEEERNAPPVTGNGPFFPPANFMVTLRALRRQQRGTLYINQEPLRKTPNIQDDPRRPGTREVSLKLMKKLHRMTRRTHPIHTNVRRYLPSCCIQIRSS